MKHFVLVETKLGHQYVFGPYPESEIHMALEISDPTESKRTSFTANNIREAEQLYPCPCRHEFLEYDLR